MSEDSVLQNHEENLKNLSWVSNRRFEQTRFLFELCDNDFNKLLALEAKLKRHVVFGCPSTKEEVNELLSVPDFYKGLDADNTYDKLMLVLGYKKNEVKLYEKV